MKDELFGKPELLRIMLDRPLESIGRLDDGTQFMAFVTGSYPDGPGPRFDGAGWEKGVVWMPVIHLFDGQGNHLKTETRADGCQSERSYDSLEHAEAELETMCARYLPMNPKHCDIEVKLFSVVLVGVTHGLIYTHHVDPEMNIDCEWVMLQPEDIMFHPPWDSGEYST